MFCHKIVLTDFMYANIEILYGHNVNDYTVYLNIPRVHTFNRFSLEI